MNATQSRLVPPSSSGAYQFDLASERWMQRASHAAEIWWDTRPESRSDLASAVPFIVHVRSRRCLISAVTLATADSGLEMPLPPRWIRHSFSMQKVGGGIVFLRRRRGLKRDSPSANACTLERGSHAQEEAAETESAVEEGEVVASDKSISAKDRGSTVGPRLRRLLPR